MPRPAFPFKPKASLPLAALILLMLLAGFDPAAQPIPVSWSNPGSLGSAPPSTYYDYVLTPGPGDTCILFGAWDWNPRISTLRNDTYQVDAAGRWSKLTVTGENPVSLIYTAGIYDEPGNRLVLFGGFLWWELGGNYNTNAVYALDLSTKVWTKLNPTGTPPAARRRHTAVFDSLRRRMVVFGGTADINGNSYFNDAYALDLATLAWSRLTPSSGSLPGLHSHCAEYLPDRDAMAIFGGEPLPSAKTNALYLYSFSDNKVTALAASGTPHPAVTEAASAYDPASDCLFIYGGYDGSQPRGEFSAVNVANGQWQTLSVGAATPGSRRAMHMATLQKPNQFVIFSGCRDSYWSLNDTWIMTLGDRVPVQLSGFAAE